MSRLAWFASIVALIVLSNLSVRPVSADTTKIGVVVPLSGGAASNGQSISNSIKMADERFDPQNKIEFIFEDDQMQPRSTVTAVKKLISQDAVKGLIVFGSPTSLAVNSIAESAHIPMIGMSVVDRVVEGKNYVVKHWVTAERENVVLTDEVRRRNYQSVAIVTTTNDAMLKLRDLFVATNRAKVVFSEEFAPGDTDFKATATKIAHLKPDAVYILLWAPQPGVFAKQLRQVRYSGALFGAHNIEDPAEVAASEGGLLGAWYVTGDDRAGKDFYDTYQKQFGSQPANGGINGYDCAKLMIEGVASGNLLNYLHTVKNFEGAYGYYSATGSNDFNMPAAIKIISESGFQFSAAQDASDGTGSTR